jgi:hypothetical protein
MFALEKLDRISRDVVSLEDGQVQVLGDTKVYLPETIEFSSKVYTKLLRSILTNNVFTMPLFKNWVSNIANWSQLLSNEDPKPSEQNITIDFDPDSEVRSVSCLDCAGKTPDGNAFTEGEINFMLNKEIEIRKQI